MDDLQVGDWVKIVRKPLPDECDAPWATPKNDTVGQIGEVFGFRRNGEAIVPYDGILYSYPRCVLEKVKAPDDWEERRNQTTTSKDGAAYMVYQHAHRYASFAEGDYVRVFRKAYDHEAGWDGTWRPKANDLIGRVGRIAADAAGGYYVFFEGYGEEYLPYFVLVKDEPQEEAMPYQNSLLASKPAQFKHFDKVLVRRSDDEIWTLSYFLAQYGKVYRCVGGTYTQCILHKGNEYLAGTTKNKEVN